MKRILVTIGGYLPGKNYGGPVTSISNFVELLKDEYKIYIVTSDHDLHSNEKYQGVSEDWNTVEYAKVKYLSEKDLSNVSILKSIIKEIQPDVIYHNGLYDRRLAIPVSKISRDAAMPPIIFVPRGDLGPVFPERKKYIKKAYVIFMRHLINRKRMIFQATSLDEEQDIINRMHVEKQDIFLIGNIPTIVKKDVTVIGKEKGSAKLIYFARVHPTKNLLVALKALKNVKGFVQFDVFGGIEDDDYWTQCQQVISELPDSIVVNYNGVVGHDEVYGHFLTHHALLFPTRNKENYGHTIVESIMAERPVIISDQSPWNDVVDYNAGWVYPGDAVDKYTLAIQKLVDMDDFEYKKLHNNIAKYKAEKFSPEAIKHEYVAMIEKILAKVKV